MASTSNASEPDQENGEVSKEPEHTADKLSEEVKQIPMPCKEKQRYDWYQTDTHVVITLLIKKVKKDDVDIQLTNKTLSVTVKLPTGSDYSLELDLAHTIVPEKSNHKVLPSKIEIKLKKEEGLRWSKLEGDDPLPSPVANVPANQPDDSVHKYPTSSHVTRNWDKIVHDFDQEEKDSASGEAALNNLFQQIYANGDDNIKKAMNKSFMESAGTVLSTNWTDIGAKKTDIKPPDGMEYKQWDS